MTNSTPQTNIHFGRFLATLRSARGMTAHQLSRRAGVGIGTIYRAEGMPKCDMRRLTALSLVKALDSARKLSPAEMSTIMAEAGLSEVASCVPQSTGSRREGGSGRSDRDLERDALSRQVQVDLIRGAIRDAKKIVDSKKGTGIPTDYECGVVAGLVMALQFMGELTADGALQLIGQRYTTLHTTNAGGEA